MASERCSEDVESDWERGVASRRCSGRGVASERRACSDEGGRGVAPGGEVVEEEWSEGVVSAADEPGGAVFISNKYSLFEWSLGPWFHTRPKAGNQSSESGCC